MIRWVGPLGRHNFIRGGYWGATSYCRGRQRGGVCGLCAALA